MRLWSRPASGDLVVVAIDSASIRALAQWPWPRRYHAAAIHRLLAAGASKIAYDIVFSSPSTPSDDLMLADALAAAGPQRISLPVFRHLRQTHDRRIEPFDTAPLAQFGQHASPASINVEPDSDGLVRRLHGKVEWAERQVPTMPAWLLSGEPIPEGEVFLGFGIDIGSIPMLSFVQLLRGNSLLTGRTWWSARSRSSSATGSACRATGRCRVPSFRQLPSKAWHKDARCIRFRAGPVALGAVLLILALGPAFGRLPRRRAVLLLGGCVVSITASAIAVQLYGAIAVDTSAGLIGLVLAFGVAMLERVEHQARALVGQIGTLPATDDMGRQLVDNSFDAIVTFGAEGNVLSYNCAAERIFGVAGQDVIGASLRGLLPDQQNGSFKTFAQVGGIHELEAKHGCGRRFPVEATSSRMQVDEKWVGIAILRDVTES